MRNHIIRILALLLATALLIGAVGCSAPEPTEVEADSPSPEPTAVPVVETPDSDGIVPGIYTAQGSGFRGHVKVYVTVDDTSIISVDIAECTDYPDHVTEIPLREIPAAIVESQSVNVDTVTGATFTSYAIIGAVKDALKQANAGDMFDREAKAREAAIGEDVYTDVLVLGGGGSGSMAALAAKYVDFDGADSGLSVTLVEKQAFLGGSTALSGGGFITALPVDTTDETILETATQTFYNKIAPYNETDNFNFELMRNIVYTSGNTLWHMGNLGMNFVISGDTVTRMGNQNFASEAAMTSLEKTGYTGFMRPNHMENSYYLNHYVGYYYNTFFVNRFATAGVDVRLNTRADELIVQDGAVVGAKVTGLNGTYNIYADKVILATGGMVQNKELIAKYAPADIDCIAFSNGGNTGDGFVMAEAVNAAVRGDRLLCYMGSNARYGMWPQYGTGFLWGKGIAVHVNKEGKRFANEIGYYSQKYYRNLLEQTDNTAYMIIDSSNPNAFQASDTLEKTDQKDVVWKADTLEELAAMIGVPADELTKTINEYNDCIEKGVNAEFDTPVESMLPVKDGPFYAMVLRPVAIGSLVGFDMTENCEVKNDSGEIISNLYAVGEMALGGNLMTVYVGGWGVGTALISGRIAGEHAKNAVLAAQ